MMTIKRNGETIVVNEEALEMEWNGQFFQYCNKEDLFADVESILNLHKVTA